AARGRLGDRCEREPGVRPDEEHRLVCTGRPRLPFPKLDVELALPHAEIDELARDRLRERLRRDATSIRERIARGAERSLGGLALGESTLQRVAAGAGTLELLHGGRAALEQLVQARGPVTPLCVGDAVQPLLHRPPSGPGPLAAVRVTD